MNYQNKIIGHEMVDPTQLLANPLNFRIHTKVQKDAMRSMLRNIGWLDEIIVNQRTGVLINGHMRVDIALTDNEPLVPVRYVDLTDEEQNLALATFDNIAALAGTDRDQLELLLSETSTQDGDLLEFLSSLQPPKMPEYDSPLPTDTTDYENQDVGGNKWLIVITCENEWQQGELLEEFESREIECRALSSG
jgi:hypothetical protein